MHPTDQDDSSASLPPGTVVAGRFRVESRIGSGAMADVYRVRDVNDDNSMALKLLREEVAGDQEAMRRLQREGEALGRLQHPAIVAMETFGALDDGRIFLAMELLEGETLGTRMRRGPMTAEQLAPIVAATAAGLSAAHEHGVIHRDLKPDNVFLAHDPDNPTPRIKVLDFGISKVYGSEKLTQTGQVLGTPRYMAPEQLSAERDLDARVDIYALGVILYEALSGQPPFPATTPSDLIVAILSGKAAPLRSVDPDVPPEIESIVMRAMARAKEARYASPIELSKAWLEATSDTAGVPRQLHGAGHSGHRTDVIGSMGPAEPVGPPDPEPALAGPPHRDERAVSPGTFHALAGPVQALSGARPSAAEGPVRPPADAPGAGSRAAGRDAAPAAIDASRGPANSASSSIRLPTDPAVRRFWVLLAAVAAGVASAGLVLAALHWWSGTLEGPRSPGMPADPPTPDVEEPSSPTPASAPDAAATTDAATARGDAPDPRGVAQPSGTDGPGRDGPAARRPRARRHGDQSPRSTPTRRGRDGPRRGSAEGAGPADMRDAPGSADAGTGVSFPAHRDSATELMAQARSARRGGEPGRCVELIERAMDRGAPASVLHLQGDCLREAGRPADARRAYERFCRLVPDHPAIGVVRAQVEALGGHCP